MDKDWDRKKGHGGFKNGIDHKRVKCTVIRGGTG